MDMFRTSFTSYQRAFSWDRLQHYAKQERPLEPFRTIIIKGPINLVFRRSKTPLLVVAAKTADALTLLKTDFRNGKLVVERNGMNTGFDYGDSAYLLEKGFVNTEPSGGDLDVDDMLVCVALPEAPAIKIKGDGYVALLDLQQSDLDLAIEGAGDVTAFGQVVHLDVEIAGSGDVNAKELVADRASLLVAGSGDMDVFIKSEVRARVAGSGDIRVFGNPQYREFSVSGTGNVHFR